jgi:hypothetical protein
MRIERCITHDECERYRKLADLLGHDREGHLILLAVRRAGITTRAQLADANLHDVRHLGTTRIAYIRRRLAETRSAGSR